MTTAKSKKAPAPKKTGRPSKLTPQLTAKIAKAIRDGLYLESACALHGVHKSTVYDWLSKADGPEPDSAIEEFSDAIGKAAAEHQLRLIRRIEAGKFGWQGALNLLGLRHPKQYSHKIREAVADAQHEVMRKLSEKLSPADYARVVAAYTGALTAPEQRPPVEDIKRLLESTGARSGFVVRVTAHQVAAEEGEHFPEVTRTDSQGRTIVYAPVNPDELPEDRRHANDVGPPDLSDEAIQRETRANRIRLGLDPVSGLPTPAYYAKHDIRPAHAGSTIPDTMHRHIDGTPD